MILFISAFLLFATSLYLATLYILSRGIGRLSLQKTDTGRPPVSVIVCAHNEEKHIVQCIEHLKAQNYPAEKVEFILVNDRSDDATEAIMQSACRKDNRFRTITISDRLPDFAPKKRAIDRAIRTAKNEIILFTDADGRPGPHWIESMASYFTDQVHMVLGYAPYTVKPANHFVKQILALEYFSHAAIAAATTGLSFPVTCVGTNMAYRKSMFLEIGGFGRFKNQISGDDDLFLTLVREQRRFNIVYATDARSHVFNNPPRLWSKFVHQRMRYASKGFKYPLKVTAALITYFMYNLLLLVLSAGFLIDGKLFLIFLSAIAVKWLAEFLFIRKAGIMLSDVRNLKVFIPAALLHIPYVVAFALLGQFDYYKWAEDQAEKGTQTIGDKR